MSVSQSEKVRVGIVGCGAITRRRHAKELAINPNARLVAFNDWVPERAEDCAATYGGVAVANWEDLVTRPDVDAVVVDTANVSHAPISVAALKAGKHVLCEKPMATSHEEAAAMISAAREAGVFLMVGQNQRLAPLHIRAKQVYDSGAIGRVVTFRTSCAHGGADHWSIDGANSWFFRRKDAFVGAMGDLGVHKADLLLWLLGEDIVEASAFVEHLAKPFGDVDDNAVCLLRTKSGAVGTLVASWTHVPGEDNTTVIYGTQGILRIGADDKYPVIVNLASGENQYYETGRLQTNEAGGQFDSGVSWAFIQSIVTGTPPAIDGDEGRRALAVILACIESAQTKKHVAVKI